MRNKTIAASLLICLTMTNLPAHAAELDCRGRQTENQRNDEDTIRRIERDWLAAELRGNTAYLDCLLAPGYAVIVTKDNSIRSKQELLAHFAANAGKTSDVPALETTVVINGDFATAYSLMKTTKKNGEPSEARFVDSYFFKDGAWHAFGGVDL